MNLPKIKKILPLLNEKKIKFSRAQKDERKKSVLVTSKGKMKIEKCYKNFSNRRCLFFIYEQVR